MTRVSYQAILSGDVGPPISGVTPGSAFVALRPGAIATRPKDATRALTVKISRDQRGWLREVEKASGGAAAADTVVRAMLDLAQELDVDWTATRGGSALRQAVADAVQVRRPTPPR